MWASNQNITLLLQKTTTQPILAVQPSNLKSSLLNHYNSRFYIHPCTYYISHRDEFLVGVCLFDLPLFLDFGFVNINLESLQLGLLASQVYILIVYRFP